MGGSAPQVPVPNTGSEISQAQQANLLAGEQSQAGSMVGQNTPFGTLSYTQTGVGPGGVPTYTASTQLSPQEQQLFSTGLGTQQTAAGGAQGLLSGANYGATNPTADLGNMTSGLTGQMENAYLQSVAPYQQQALGSEQATLANQGLTPGNKAYDLAMQNFVQGQNQANLGAAAQFEPQAYSQALQNYQLPAQMAESLFSVGTPASLSQNLINTPTESITPPDVLGAYQQALSAEQTNAQLQEQQYGSMMSGMFGLGAAGIKALPFMGSGVSIGSGIGGLTPFIGAV